MARKTKVPNLALLSGKQKKVKDEFLSPALLAEFRAAVSAKQVAEQAAEEHNAKVQPIQTQVVETQAVFKHVYARIAKLHDLGQQDGIEVKTGKVVRGAFRETPPTEGAPS